MLANLIRKTFQPSEQENGSIDGLSVTATDKSSFSQQASNEFTNPDGLTILSNDNPNEDRLNLLLGIKTPEQSNENSSYGSSTPLSGGQSLVQSPWDDVKVDVTLRTQLGQAPALMLLIADHQGREDDFSSSVQPRQIAICFEVGLNGQVSVVETAGLANGGSGGDAEMQGTDDAGSSTGEIQKQIARVLEVSQDLGILVEWVLRWLQQRAGG